MNFKFGYLGGSNIGESYNRLLSTSDLDSLDKEEEYLILCNLPHGWSTKAQLCWLEYRTEFEIYNSETDTYEDKDIWVVAPVSDDDFEATDLESKFLILNKDDWEF